MRGILWLLAITISAIIIMHCTTRFDFEGDVDLKHSFIRAVNPVTTGKCDGDSMVFRLDTLTKFQWDKVYFFYSYNFPTMVDERLGRKWASPRLEMNDYDNLIIFMKNGDVVNYLGFKPNIDEFSIETKADFKGYYTPKTAIISFRKVCYNSQTGYRNILRLNSLSEINKSIEYIIPTGH